MKKLVLELLTLLKFAGLGALSVLVIGSGLLAIDSANSIRRAVKAQEQQKERLQALKQAAKDPQKRMMMGVKIITLEQLKQANSPTKCWVAYQGIVYDVTQNPLWEGCKHHGYSGGQDITSLFPHPTSYLDSLPVVGVLETYAASMSPHKMKEIRQPKERMIPWSEVVKHNNARSCWVVVDGYVYDVTDFIEKHPGGYEILEGCGRDLSGLFGYGIHKTEGRDYLPVFKIGKVTGQRPRYMYYYDD